MATEQYYQSLRALMQEQNINYVEARMLWRKLKRNDKPTKNKAIGSSMKKYWSDIITIMHDEQITKEEARVMWRMEHE